MSTLVATKQFIYAPVYGGPSVWRAPIANPTTGTKAIAPSDPDWKGQLPPYGAASVFDGQHAISCWPRKGPATVATACRISRSITTARSGDTSNPEVRPFRFRVGHFAGELQFFAYARAVAAACGSAASTKVAYSSNAGCASAQRPT
jgi:hypothetical protein